MKKLTQYGLGLFAGLLVISSSAVLAKPVCSPPGLLYDATFSKAYLLEVAGNLNVYQLKGTSYSYKNYKYNVFTVAVCNKNNMAACKNNFANAYRESVSQAGKLLKAHYSQQPKDGYLTLTCIYQVPKPVSGIDAVVATVEYKQ